MRPIFLVGGGGHCKSCIDVIESNGAFLIKGIVERDAVAGSVVDVSYPLLGTDIDLGVLLASCPSALVTVGQVGSFSVRTRLFDHLVQLGAELPAIVSPFAYVSRKSQISRGTIVMHGAIVNAAATVGENCIVNSQALIEHDAVVGAHCHISTGAKINGMVKVGNGTFIGSGTTIREGVRIGENSVIGAGSLVLHNVAPGSRVWGIV